MKRIKKITAIVLAWVMVVSSLFGTVGEEAKAVERVFEDSLKIARDGSVLTLSWTAKDGADLYEIWRSTGTYSTYEKIDEVNQTSYRVEVGGSVYQYYFKIVAKQNGQELSTSNVDGMDLELWGDCVDIFSPSDESAKINNRIKSISDKMMKASQAHWSDERYALMFKPGTYNIDKINVGFYTQVLGLGATPYDTSIPNVNVDSAANGNVLINFWRGIENIAVDTGNKTTEVKWGASQAAPVRRVYINGKLHLDDIGMSASGGFLADSYIEGQTGSWSQQQFYLRNNHMSEGWYDGVWNILFQGCTNAPESSADWANAGYHGYTTVDHTERVKEKPFVYLCDGEYKVFVPGLRTNAKDVSWSADTMGRGRSIDIEDFYIAKAGQDSAETINNALDAGKNIIFTPGIYRLNKSINVDNPDTVILGLGLATLVCDNTDTAIHIADKDGVTVAGLLIEAGENESNTLLKIGDEKNLVEHKENPILLSDVFVRVGGARIGKVKTSVEINSNDVIGDHFWLWRADHGTGASWNEATADYGLIVNGDNVNIYGLFVEHFRKYQTLWNGENGKTYFYQCELPYDVPSQADWMSDKNGYAAYKVNDEVQSHEATALGVYEVFIYTGEYMKLDCAIEVPESARITNACTVSLGNVNGEITHIVNDKGGAVGFGISQQGVKVGLNSYPVNDVKTTSKKGVSSWYYASGSNASQRDVNIFKKAGINWFYNWGAVDDVAREANASGLSYVPMVWGQWSVNGSEMARLAQGREEGLYDTLLAFNEPDLGDQANMSVDKAIELWPKLEATGLRLGSPAGAAVEDAWVEEFMAKAKEKGYRVDFLTLHVYQDFTHPGSVNSLKAALERLHNKYHLPIWITEIGNVDVSTQWWGYNLYQEMSHDVARTYIKQVGELLESLDYVERYAWFVDYSDNISGTAYTRLFDISDGSLTPEGQEYKLIDKKKVEPTTEVTTTEESTQQPTAQPETQKPSGETITIIPSEQKTTYVQPVNAGGEVKKPAKVKIKKLYRKKKSAKKIKLKVKKLKGVNGYQVVIYKNKTAAKKNKKAILKKYVKRNKALLIVKSKKLKNKVKLFVKVRGYVKGKRGVLFGTWSDIKRVKRYQ
ncbi:MAG: hypothetical protein K6G64_06555 [Eubacterium sp.]|nr:hypothetical protein [Eubacterium sp.]